MKLRHIIPVSIALAAMALTACSDMLNLKSDDYVYAGDNPLNSANDSLYSAMGILTQMQKLGERYVLLGELRGDLVDVTADAPLSIQQVSNFATSEGNDFSGRRDYYSVINNCNYALTHMDTTITEHENRVMVPEYVAIRTLRAWTYLQMGLTYGRVRYVETPLLSLEETEMNYPVVELDALIDRLVADLERYAGNRTPDYGSNDGLDTRRFFIEPRLLLADLYLYRGQYEDAARFYYDYIREHSLTVGSYLNTWITNQATAPSTQDFLNSFSIETLSEIPYASDVKKIHPNLVNMTYNRKPTLVVAPWFVDEMGLRTHYHTDNAQAVAITGVLEGDLRGRFLMPATGAQIPVSFGSVAGMPDNQVLITKFYNTATYESTLLNPDNTIAAGFYTRELPLYRIPHVYLRYAEALNRLGKPSLAFAVLRYGLSSETLADETKVNPMELEDEVYWTNFSATTFDSNIGITARGCGRGVKLPGCSYVMPEFDTTLELTEWVEDQILYELAAETQFEGNRFFDLMRISRHRGGTEYFADCVSRRFANPAAIRARLLDRENWWVK